MAGRVGLEFLPDPNSPKLTLSPQQTFTVPLPLEMPLPVYPQKALVSETVPVTLVARIIVEEDGTVREVHESPLGEQLERGVGEPFWTAVEQAVRAWRFTPATIRTFEEGPDIDGDGTLDYGMLVEARPVRAYLDLRFKFEVVDGRGRVQIGPIR